jgi:hypothetical protein
VAADDYEKKFMAGGDAVYRERHVARIFTALMALPALLTFGIGVAILFSAHRPAAAAIGPFFASAVVSFVALFWAVMRITVTRDTLRVDYGMLGAEIPLSAITSCKLDAQIGAGAKWAPGGWRYAPVGTTRGVSVTWTQGGKTKHCYIGSNDPEALLRSIHRDAGARARIAAPESQEDEAIRREAEAEAEAAVGEAKADDRRAG